MARTEQKLDRRGREVVDLWMLPRPAKSLQNGAGFIRETRAYWACRKGKSGLGAIESSWQVYRSCFCGNEKEQTVCPEYQIVKWERIKVSKIPTLARERGIRVGAWGGEGGLQSDKRQVPRRMGSQARRTSRAEIERSMSR